MHGEVQKVHLDLKDGKVVAHAFARPATKRYPVLVQARLPLLSQPPEHCAVERYTQEIAVERYIFAATVSLAMIWWQQSLLQQYLVRDQNLQAHDRSITVTWRL